MECDFFCVGRGEAAQGFWRQPDRYRILLDLDTHRKHTVQGAGLSLAGAGFGSANVVTGMTRFDRILDFDAENCRIRVEAGISLDKLFRFLAPRKVCLPVQPGYPGLTVGGCIAGNVHGKNQFREGNFRNCVLEIELFHPARGVFRLSPETDPALFDLTCGGLGLTGIVVSATLALKPMPSRRYQVTNLAVSGWADAVERMAEACDNHDFVYSWHDAARGGRGTIIVGDNMGDDEASEGRHAFGKINPSRAGSPVVLLNKSTLPLVNWVYFLWNTTAKKTCFLDAYDAYFPFASRSFYFSMLGRRGFVEHQALVPHESISSYTKEVQRLIDRRSVAISLATLKAFSGRQKGLWFVGDGISLALHVGNDAAARSFLAELDRIDLDHGAIANLIKDSRLPGAIARRQYPDFEAVRQALSDYDPHRMFESELSRRIGL